MIALARKRPHHAAWLSTDPSWLSDSHTVCDLCRPEPRSWSLCLAETRRDMFPLCGCLYYSQIQKPWLSRPGVSIPFTEALT